MGVYLRIIIITCFLLGVSNLMVAQIISNGSPQIINYSAEDYSAADQNWHIFQDSRGLMFFGNSSGLLEFDGADWSLLPLPGENIVWRIAEDKNGTIYVAGSGELGYLRSNSRGVLTYHSLLDRIPEDMRNFRDIWGLYYYQNAIVFIAYNKLYCINDDKVTLLNEDSRIAELGIFNDTLYLETGSKGVCYLDKGKLVKAAGFGNKMRFRRLIKWDDKTQLLTGREKGLFINREGNLSRWITELDTYFPNLDIYHITALNHSYFAVATVKNGVLIIDKQGKILRHINNKNGLPSNTVYYLFVDNQKKLWAAHNHGLSCIEIFSPYTHFTSQNNLASTINASVLFNEKLYLGGEPYLYYIDWPLKNNLDIPQFTSIDLSTGQIYDLIVYKNKLFCNHQRGVTVIDENNEHSTIKLSSPCWGMIAFGREEKQIFTCSNSELYVIAQKSNKWQLKHSVKGHHSYDKRIGFDYNNYLWTYARNEGLARLKLNAEMDSVIDKTIFSHIKNQEIKINSDLRIVDQQVFVFLANKIYAFNSFINDFTEVDFEFDGTIYGIIEWKEQESVWLLTSEGNIKFEKKSGAKYLANMDEKLSFRNFSRTNFIKTFPNEDMVFMHSKGVSYYHNQHTKNKNYELSSRIRKVKLINNDSVVFGGTWPLNDSVFSRNQANNVIKDFEYKDNSLRFLFGTWIPQIYKEINYQYKLENFDDHWSKWTTETTKDYTNLSAGVYTFVVKAKSPSQSSGEIAKFTFRILSPWYFTAKAYVMYLILLFSLIFIIYKIIRNRVRKKFQKAEKDIKIDLFTNISHEIKTPITLILSPLEEIIAKSNFDEENNSLHMLMYRNAKKLKHLVNLLLDLRRVETGSMNLQVKNDDIVQFVEDIFIPFNYIAKQNKIEYQLDSVFDSKDLFFDNQKLEIILTNLLSNAFKYTAKEGRIGVFISEGNNHNQVLLEDFKNSEPTLKIGKLKTTNFIEISIEDTGEGISESEMTKIFNKFYHENKRNYLNTQSTGIGLAFTEKLVRLHRCELLVWSKLGYGSKFLIRLSLDENYYLSSEIAEDNGDETQVEKTEKQNQPENKEIVEEKGTKPNILVVDDDTDMRQYLHQLLEKKYFVLEAEDGEQALKLVRQELPDLIISDIKMPNMTGVELCRKVKNDSFTAHIPIMLLTGSSNEKLQFESFESGANQYLSKPFNPKMLMVRVSGLIENSVKVKKQINTEQFDDISSLVKDIPESENLLNKATEIINDNLSDSEFNINALAKALRLSRTILYRKFKEHTDITPNEYIQVIRLKKSKSLLSRLDLTISEVAYLVGYNDAKYFSTSFKKHFNMTPKEYRISQQEVNEKESN